MEVQAEMELQGRDLVIKRRTTGLAAYRYKSAENKDLRVFVVFHDDDIHVVQLDEDEQTFYRVKSVNEAKKVQILDDEEIKQLIAELDDSQKEMMSALFNATEPQTPEGETD